MIHTNKRVEALIEAEMEIWKSIKDRIEPTKRLRVERAWLGIGWDLVDVLRFEGITLVHMSTGVI